MEAPEQADALVQAMGGGGVDGDAAETEPDCVEIMAEPVAAVLDRLWAFAEVQGWSSTYPLPPSDVVLPRETLKMIGKLMVETVEAHWKRCTTALRTQSECLQATLCAAESRSRALSWALAASRVRVASLEYRLETGGAKLASAYAAMSSRCSDASSRAMVAALSAAEFRGRTSLEAMRVQVAALESQLKSVGDKLASADPARSSSCSDVSSRAMVTAARVQARAERSVRPPEVHPTVRGWPEESDDEPMAGGASPQESESRGHAKDEVTSSNASAKAPAIGGDADAMAEDAREDEGENVTDGEGEGEDNAEAEAEAEDDVLIGVESESDVSKFDPSEVESKVEEESKSGVKAVSKSKRKGESEGDGAKMHCIKPTSEVEGASEGAFEGASDEVFDKASDEVSTLAYAASPVDTARAAVAASALPAALAGAASPVGAVAAIATPAGEDEGWKEDEELEEKPEEELGETLEEELQDEEDEEEQNEQGELKEDMQGELQGEEGQQQRDEEAPSIGGDADAMAEDAREDEGENVPEGEGEAEAEAKG